MSTAPGAARDAEPAVFEPWRALVDAVACAALASWAEVLRTEGYNGNEAAVVGADGVVDVASAAAAVVQLARGEVVPAERVVDALGREAVGALQRVGVIERRDEMARATARVFPMRSIMSLLPAPADGTDTVYIGPDSVVLFEHVWRDGGIGARACDLGTGNGFIAGALATRFEHVVAADLSGRCVATAALIPVLNPHLRGRFGAVRADVAGGLAAGSFDLVSANAPWVPEKVDPAAGAHRVFAAGGPTGFELPRRFIDAAAGLLRPGGRAFVACLDVTFDDGRRLLPAHLETVSAGGLEVEATESRMNQRADFTGWAQGRLDGVRSAVHTIVTVRRPT